MLAREPGARAAASAAGAATPPRTGHGASCLETSSAAAPNRSCAFGRGPLICTNQGTASRREAVTRAVVHARAGRRREPLGIPSAEGEDVDHRAASAVPRMDGQSGMRCVPEADPILRERASGGSAAQTVLCANRGHWPQPDGACGSPRCRALYPGSRGGSRAGRERWFFGVTGSSRGSCRPERPRASRRWPDCRCSEFPRELAARAAGPKR